MDRKPIGDADGFVWGGPKPKTVAEGLFPGEKVVIGLDLAHDEATRRDDELERLRERVKRGEISDGAAAMAVGMLALRPIEKGQVVHYGKDAVPAKVEREAPVASFADIVMPPASPACAEREALLRHCDEQLARAVLRQSDVAPHRCSCGALCPDRWLACWACQPGFPTATPEALAAFAPPPWPAWCAWGRDDPYEARRVDALDAASGWAVPSRGLAEAVARAEADLAAQVHRKGDAEARVDRLRALLAEAKLPG
jgi:hypothetical protein